MKNYIQHFSSYYTESQYFPIVFMSWIDEIAAIAYDASIPLFLKLTNNFARLVSFSCGLYNQDKVLICCDFL